MFRLMELNSNQRNILIFLRKSVKYFNENLTLLRTGWGLSKKAMAEKFTVSQSTYARWEESTDPDLDTLLALADFFKVPFGDFITKKLAHKDIPPRWGGREYPQQPDETQTEVQEPSGNEALRTEVGKLQAEVEQLKASFAGLGKDGLNKLDVLKALQTITGYLEAGLEEEDYITEKKAYLERLAATLKGDGK
jgi:transcriptional regulator with XRE-family HTH domain